MSRRDWLRHPARNSPVPPDCPSGLPRFRTLRLAQQAVHVSLSDAPMTAASCTFCDGAHLIDRVTLPEQPDGICDPSYSPAPGGSGRKLASDPLLDVDTIKVKGGYL